MNGDANHAEENEMKNFTRNALIVIALVWTLGSVALPMIDLPEGNIFNSHSQIAHAITDR